MGRGQATAKEGSVVDTQNVEGMRGQEEYLIYHVYSREVASQKCWSGVPLPSLMSTVER